VLVATLGLMASCGGSGEARPFRSAVYGYSVPRADGWTVVEATRRLEEGEPPATGSGATDILGRGASTDVSAMTPPAVIIGGQPVAPETTVDAWADAVVGIVTFMKGCRRPDAQERVTVGGEPAVLLTYDECPPGSGLVHRWIAVVHEGVGFHVVWFDETGRGEADRPALDALLSRWSFDG
jgi:hypothetical protein